MELHFDCVFYYASEQLAGREDSRLSWTSAHALFVELLSQMARIVAEAAIPRTWRRRAAH